METPAISARTDTAAERPVADTAQTWWFELIASDIDLAVWVEHVWWPDERRARYVACAVGRARRQLVVIDDEIPLRAPTPSLEFRHHEIWAQHVCETPYDHWTVGLEAYGVVVDDPVAAIERPWGERVGFGLDVEWEALAAPQHSVAGYTQRCRVSGEILIGAEEHGVDVWGWRGRTFGASSPTLRTRTAQIQAPRAGVVVLAEAPAGGFHPAPWAHHRALAMIDDQLGWWEEGADGVDRRVPSST